MEIKYTPWRMRYIKRGDAAEEGCVFCAITAADSASDAERLVLYRGQHCFVVMNIYPYNTAHLMVVPYLHVADLTMLDSHVAGELFTLTQQCVAIVQQEYTPHGFNLGMNLGRVAGAGIADHLHMHIVPRWNGDNNFMPVIGNTKLIPEALDETYARLRPHFAALNSASDQ
ncbi:HIT domain-containing protein [Chloroflexus sp.]|uniref:HIT family protein n=1 Tax=Chloroflexus sp. TaxID=1904827 RepID=UPI002ACDBE4C|nr:HIT domain-containing protein [Chloroflexus sp.]